MADSPKMQQTGGVSIAHATSHLPKAMQAASAPALGRRVAAGSAPLGSATASPVGTPILYDNSAAGPVIVHDVSHLPPAMQAAMRAPPASRRMAAGAPYAPALASPAGPRVVVEPIWDAQTGPPKVVSFPLIGERLNYPPVGTPILHPPFRGVGMPEPLTSRKSASKPCCDECGEADAIGKPRPCGCKTTTARAMGATNFASDAPEGAGAVLPGSAVPSIHVGPDISSAVPIMNYHCAINWTGLEWRALEHVRGVLSGVGGGREWWRDAFPDPGDPRAFPRDCVEAVRYASDIPGSIPGAGGTLFPDNLSGGYMLGFNTQLHALFTSTDIDLQSGALTAFQKLQRYPGGMAASLPATLLATYVGRFVPCAVFPGVFGSTWVNLVGMAPIPYCIVDPSSNPGSMPCDCSNCSDGRQTRNCIYRCAPYYLPIKCNCWAGCNPYTTRGRLDSDCSCRRT